jgi:hypothetical protein
MKELIRHILKENRLQQEMKQFIEDNNIFDAAEMVGGLDNLKSILKDDPEMSSLFEKLTGTIIFDYYVNKEHIEFPLDYEIIGRKSNNHKTNHWPEINVLYDENKLTPEENDTFKSMIKNLADDAQHSGFKSKFDDGRIFNANYLTVVELNGENIDSIWGGHYPWIYEVEEIYDKLYGRTESLNESKSEDKKLDLVKQMILQLFDEVEYIEIGEIYGKPLIRIYHDVENTAVNYDNWFEEVIEDKIDEMTGGNIILCSWWTPQWHYKRKNADFFIDVERIDYDDDGNKINESEEKQPKYLDIIKDIVEPFKNEDCVCDIKVSYDEDDMYLIDVEVGLFELREKFYAEVGRNHYVKKIRVDIKEAIKGYIPIDNYYVGSHATPKCGEKRWWDKNINESDNKEQSLQKLVDEYGLYDIIKMSGLDFNQVKSLLSKIENPKEILKQYIREFVLEHDGMSGDNYGSLFALNLPLSDTKYVNDILVQDSGQSAVEIWEYHLDEYGHREQKDQYLTSIITLTNDELLSILSWMMEVIEGGYWD